MCVCFVWEYGNDNMHRESLAITFSKRRLSRFGKMCETGPFMWEVASVIDKLMHDLYIDMSHGRSKIIIVIKRN